MPAIVIALIGLLAACVLLVIGIIRSAPEGYEHRGGFSEVVRKRPGKAEKLEKKK